MVPKMIGQVQFALSGFDRFGSMQTHDLEIPTLIRAADAAKFLKISQRNVVRLQNKGRVPCYRTGKSLRYSREKLMAAVEVAMEVEYAYP
jgi:excisionase family DNA binding protein